MFDITTECDSMGCPSIPFEPSHLNRGSSAAQTASVNSERWRDRSVAAVGGGGGTGCAVQRLHVAVSDSSAH
ncbi:hypothetical protein EVAR_21704_1 [Eumeta japonica]|uniref:Uncharacterized protein n=1 Tax=Eumeta variegata TaxID=151549 RepID=A0A4C1W7R6_EUMVA|nr:hypothetical protein EVAR_21704_1 [Eumeta japonica]